jgi:peptidoglycan pentaglycine glycine transferase (the first glycine)
MPLEIKIIDSEQVWSNFLQNHPQSTFLQSWTWGEFQSHGLGKRIFRLGIYENDQLLGVCLGLEEIARFGRFIYCPRGPVIDWSNPENTKHVLQSLTQHFQKQNYFHLRLDPALLEQDAEQTKVFSELKFKPAIKAIQVERAWVLDIAGKNEEGLLKGMRKNTRYYVKKGQKNGLAVRFSNSQEDLEKFIVMLKDMSKRKGFLVFEENYLRQEFKYLAPAKIVKLVIAEFEEKPVAMALVGYYGREASYLHAASAPDERKLEPSYYLQWQSLKHAQELGLERYNFWGVVSDDKYHPSHPGYGYSNFKRGFGGNVEVYQRTQDFVYSPIPYQLFRWQEWYRAKRAKGV